MAFSNKQQINSMESSVNTLAETKQNILNDTNKNEVSLLKLTATNLYAGIFYYLGQPLEQLLGNKWQINPAPFRGFICGLFPGRLWGDKRCSYTKELGTCTGNVASRREI